MAGGREGEMVRLGGPNDGHTFEISVSCRGSYAVTGDPQHFDTDGFGDPVTIQIRAWDLPAALRMAAATPLYAWSWPLTDDEEVPCE